ncbi:Hypothetical predicted protein [Pelobates cultripes]|uniref:Uncharacterized protein n=1 Tax=Pelobates cultripes TaxID=61616 RepID=A0AAD1WYW6_PELCU|nr:Hypothetical predicted protein [Pelobates cultripes]
MAAMHLHDTTSLGGQEWREQFEAKFEALCSNFWQRLHSKHLPFVAPAVTQATSCTGTEAKWILTLQNIHSAWPEGTRYSPEENRYSQAWTVSGIG